MKVGDKVHLLASHSSYGDKELAAGRYVGVIKSIEPDPDPKIITRCVEVLWADADPPGISWHFPGSLEVLNESR